MNQFLFYALVSGFLWGLWPLLMKASDLKGLWPFLISYGGALGVGVFVLVLSKNIVLPAPKGVGICILAGLLNGCAALCFIKITGSSDKLASISSLYSFCLMLELVVGFVGGCYCFGEEVTTRKFFGCIAAGIAMWLFA